MGDHGVVHDDLRAGQARCVDQGGRAVVVAVALVGAGALESGDAGRESHGAGRIEPAGIQRTGDARAADVLERVVVVVRAPAPADGRCEARPVQREAAHARVRAARVDADHELVPWGRLVHDGEPSSGPAPHRC